MNVSLGEGSFGAVYLFKSRQDPNRDYAVKILIKETLDPLVLTMAREETAILAMLDHPNIVKYVESYEDNRYMYIVMEYLAQATELFEVIQKQRKLKVSNGPDNGNESLFPID